MKIGTKRSAVTLNRNWPFSQRVRHKIANGEVCIEREIRPGKGKASCNDRLKAIDLRRAAQIFRGSFAFAISGICLQRVWSAQVRFWNVSDGRRLGPIDRP